MVDKRLVLLGHSLGMPDPANMLDYEDTYPFLISKKCSCFEVLSRLSRGRDTKFQASDQQINDDILWLKPDVICIDLGVVDCAPRLFNKFGQVVLSKVPNPLRDWIIMLFANYRCFFTKTFKKVYVSKKKFAENMENIIVAGLQVQAKIIVISVIIPPENICARSFGFKKNVIQYNQILQRLSEKYSCRFIDVNNILNSSLHLNNDGIHLNKLGSVVLAETIVDNI